MAEPIGLSAASASIAAIQLVARLSSISAAFFKATSVSQDFKILQVHYDIELVRLRTILQVLRPGAPDSLSIPMHVFEELYLELRKQAVELESFQTGEKGTAPTALSRFKFSRWNLKDKRRIEGFIDVLRRYCNTLREIAEINALTLRRTEALSPRSKVSVFTQSFLPPRFDMRFSLAMQAPAPSAESSLGLKVVRSPEDMGIDIGVDVIFIHGLQARSLATWSGVDVFWPGDLLKDEIPNARILTFDYDFGPSSHVTKGRILLEAKNLIQDIEQLTQDSRARCPLVFCAHSFGGLLLKTALTYCHRAKSFDDSCKGILARTKGALFFGVPSPIGSSTSWFSEYLSKILSSEYGVDQSISIDLANKFSGEFGEIFRADSEVFRDLSRSRGWSTFSFYESKAAVSRSGHVFITALRDIQHGEHVHVLPGDHYTMCKFQTTTDVGFSIVCRHLKRAFLGGQIPALDPDMIEVRKTKGKISDILESSQIYNKSFDRYVKLLGDQLGPQSFVPLDPDQSPAWLARNENFHSWICGYTKRLTICGSAGSGKTHLVRHIVSQLKPNNGFQSQREDREVLVHFVDWKDKDRLAPTFVLRSFLLQLLKSNPGLFKQVHTRMHDPPLIYEDLEQLLVDLLSNSRIQELTLVVHGIDNMDEPSRDQIAGTLVRLLSAKKGMPNAKVLLSCRASGVFSEKVEELFSRLGFGKSEMSELSLDAVALAGQSSEEFEKHVRRCITAMPNSHKLSSELRYLIEECLITKTMSVGRVQRADESNVAPKSLLNNFLWISLVAELIGSEQSPSKIRELLGKVTKELNDLESVYTELIKRTSSHVDITRILRFIQCARRPLAIEELAFAIAIRAQHSSAQKVVDQQFFSLDTILEQYASALVLFQNDTVSLRHPSMSDHWEKHLSLSATDTHAELAKACLWSLFLGPGNHADLAPITIEGVPPDNALFDIFTHPLMRYASECWFEHVRLALPNDSDQFVLHLTIKFVRSDVGRRWKDWYCKVGGKDDYPSEASPVHVFAALNLLSNPKTFRFFYRDLSKQDDSGKSVIYYAAANNAHATIDMILDHHGKDQLFDITGQDMLYLAVTKTNLRLLTKILEQPNLAIPQSLLIAAIDGRHWSAFELLKQHLEHSRPRKEAHRFWASFSDENGRVLHHAVLSRNLALVEAFLNEGADLNDNTGGKTPLHVAAQIGDELITEALLKAGGDVNVKDGEQGNTPLHYATEVGSPNVFNLLTDCGAKIGMPNYKGQTALHVAARYGHEDIVLLLLASGAEVNGKDKESTTPLHLACAGSWQPVVRRLLDQGGNPYSMTEKNRTPLHLAAANGSREIAGMLLDAGADVNARDSAQQTPLHAAVQRGSVDLVLMLIERGADPSATDEYGKSPLHYAAASDSASAKIVQLLMERGADVDIRDNEQQKTALDFAQADGNNIIAALLKAPRPMPRGPWGVNRSGSWIEGESLKSEPSMESLTGKEVVILEGKKYRQIP